MGRRFEFYTFSLDFFYNEILGSKSQDLIDHAYKKLLEWELEFGEEDTRNVFLDLYRFQLNLLVNEGKYESGDFPWDNYSFKRSAEWVEEEFKYFTKVEAISALFTLNPEYYGFGGFGVCNYWELFEDIQKVVSKAEQAADLWGLLLNGRPLSGDNNYVFKSDTPKYNGFIAYDSPNYYGYLTNAELKKLFRSVELSLSPEDLAKLKGDSYLEDKTLLTALDPVIREFSTSEKDIFFKVS